MKHVLYSGAAAVALSAGMANAEQLTVFGPWLGPDQEMVEQVLGAFAEQSGHDVSYVGSDSLFAVVEGGIPLETMLVKQGTEATDAGLGQLTAAIDGEASCQPALAFVARI